MTRLVLNHETYDAVLREIVPSAQKFLWILTADIKDVFVKGGGKKFVPSWRSWLPNYAMAWRFG